jgi:hypothetical protein
MEDFSELEQFLQSQSDAGAQKGEGVFTVAREKALEKLANFQLPFEGAWAVKIFQAAISAGAQKAFRATLGRRVATFRFDSSRAWELEEVEEAFFNPEPSDVRHVNHLVSALWAVGVAERRSFQVRVEGASYSLVWDGECLQRAPTREETQGIEIVVATFLSRSDPLHILGRRNQTLASALKDWCFTSPIPLLVDSQRMDALQHCPGYGWNTSSFPIALSFVEADLPDLLIPQGTFRSHSEFQNSEVMDGAGLETIAKKMMQKLGPIECSSAAALVSVHAVLDSDVENGSVKFWSLRHRSSKCFWVQDGVAVQSQNFDVPTNPCALACFLNADGMDNDLTGFYLANEEERARRVELVGVELLETVRSLNKVSKNEVRKHNESRYRKLGNATLLLGVGIGHFITWGIGAILVSFGLFSRFAERAEERKLLGGLAVDLGIFQTRWEESYGRPKDKSSV